MAQTIFNKVFGYGVCDGTQWKLVYECNNGYKPVRLNGGNSYPYNFDRFKMILDIDDTKGD